MTQPQQSLIKLNENLAILQEREAKYGGSAPLELLNQLDDHRRAIALTRQVIAGELGEAAWQAEMQPLLLPFYQGLSQSVLAALLDTAADSAPVRHLRQATEAHLQQTPRGQLLLEGWRSEPVIYEKPVAHELAHSLQINAELTTRLHRLLAEVETGSGPVSAGERGVVAGRDITAGGDIVTGTKIQQEARGSNIAQAGPGGHAEVNRSVFDMRGQTVGRQFNIDGDYIQSREGDTITMSGDFRGALVNVKSTLDNVTQTINAAPNLESSLKAELSGLVEQLGRELAQTPSARVEEAEAVSQAAELLVETATAEKPNRPFIKITGEGLKQAAQNIADVLPTVLVIATRIVGAITGIGG